MIVLEVNYLTSRYITHLGQWRAFGKFVGFKTSKLITILSVVATLSGVLPYEDPLKGLSQIDGLQ